MSDDLFSLMAARTGHFLLESGHHGDLWLNLDLLLLQPTRLRPFVAKLARDLSIHIVDVVCGPMVGGALVANMVALELNAMFVYAERVIGTQSSVTYVISDGLRTLVKDKRVAVIDDVINAGSAVRATIADLKSCGARVVAVGALLALGESAATIAQEESSALSFVAQRPNNIWLPAECPMCAAGQALDRT
jgi:orotate phosphoribosyltransferase